MRRLAPAIALFFLAPAVGELLLGNSSLGQAPFFLPVLAPMYGGGALLIRETARRTGRGPATMLVLGVAYGLWEEGLADQILFNRHYAGHDEMGDTYIPALGMGGWLTVGVLTMHAVWSTNTGIALVEALVPERAERPWLGRTGLAVTAAIFLAGSAVVVWGSYQEEHFFAAPRQLLGTAAVIVVIVVLAFRRRPPAPLPGRAPLQGRAPLRGRAPRQWIAGVAAFVAGGAFLSTSDLPGWWSVAAAVALLAVAVIAIGRWSRRPGWGRGHRLALAAGALLTYAWVGLGADPESGPKTTGDLVMSIVLAAGAVALVAVAIHRVRAVRPS